MELSTAARNAAVTAVVGLVDAAATAGEVSVYTGTKPGTGVAATGTLLVTFALADPAYGAPAAGVSTLLGTPIAGTPVATGTAGWYRMTDGDGTVVQDGTCGSSGSGADMILSTTSLVSGTPVEITAGSYTQPAE